MKPAFPWQSSGVTYCTGTEGHRICTGSKMGRANIIPVNRKPSDTPKLRLCRVPFVDQCYDQGGAYWGAPANLYCAWSQLPCDPFKWYGHITFYFRANSRADAKARALAVYPGATFYR